MESHSCPSWQILGIINNADAAHVVPDNLWHLVQACRPWQLAHVHIRRPVSLCSLQTRSQVPRSTAFVIHQCHRNVTSEREHMWIHSIATEKETAGVFEAFFLITRVITLNVRIVPTARHSLFWPSKVNMKYPDSYICSRHLPEPASPFPKRSSLGLISLAFVVGILLGFLQRFVLSEAEVISVSDTKERASLCMWRIAI